MKLNPVTDIFLSNLRSQLPEATFREVSPRYLEEQRGLFQGQAGAVFAPATVDDVATIIRAASAASVGVVPYGGGTGLVGGQVMQEGPLPIIVSLERMNAIRSVYPSENILIVEAGAILHDIHVAAENADRLFPLMLASEGSCQIGGNLSTNAGGVNVLRYGNSRELCLGLEAVLPDGTIWHGLKRLRKDNTGYDLRNLLIGAEGTLGVITAAVLRLFPRPSKRAAALMVVPDPAAAVELLALTGNHAGNNVSMFELLNRTGLDFLAETMPEVRLPFGEIPEWMVLIDLGTIGDGEPETMLTNLFEEALDKDIVSDGLIAQSEGQRQQFLTVRESIPEANKRIGSIASHDISLPISSIGEFVEAGNAALKTVGDIRINCFGHLGDGNLHYNIFPAKGLKKTDYPGVADEARRIVHDLVAEYDGSFSAEHGVGRLKMQELERYGDPAKLAAMHAIKNALDPKGIMNPGAVLRA
ncbi:MAG: FAD-binding oxidoreductase [Paracoccaceae bacterium]